jgi:hypothetical protein
MIKSSDHLFPRYIDKATFCVKKQKRNCIFHYIETALSEIIHLLTFYLLRLFISEYIYFNEVTYD